MPFSTTPPARWYHTQQIHYLRKDVSFDTPNIGTAATVPVGTLPANAVIVTCIVKIVTAFNAATTNVLTVGDSVGGDSTVFGAADVNETVAATTIVAAAVGYRFSATVDGTLYVRYTQTGTAATAGAAIIMIGYIPPVPAL